MDIAITCVPLFTWFRRKPQEKIRARTDSVIPGTHRLSFADNIDIFNENLIFYIIEYV